VESYASGDLRHSRLSQHAAGDRHVDRIPTTVPLRLPGLHVFSPFGGRGLAMLQARGGLHGE
jgi:hypothetical protein